MILQRTTHLLTIFLAAIALLSSCNGPEQTERKAAHITPSERQFNWQRQELTAFLHFGINTFYGREWGNGAEDPARFNPSELDADQWISTLAQSGFKCAILTCKHHDGFCLWPSAYTGHSVKNSPWKEGNGDVVKEVADACHRHGIGFGVYLSPWDRNSSLYGTDEYNDYFVNQLTELLTNYGDVAEVWLDGACGEGPNGRVQEYDFERWYAVVRELQPDAVIAIMGPDVRWVGTENCIGRATEWSVVPTGADETLAWYPVEVDVSIRPGWFYHEDEDDSVKSPEQLMDIYFTSVGMNGVLLLNIPPDTRGLLADADIESLKGFKALRDEMASSSIFRDSPQRGRARKVTDGNYDTHIVMKPDQELVFSLDEEKTFNALCIQEDIRFGQRVKSFALDVQLPDGSWAEVASGTTIGHKRLLHLDETTASKLRLRIIESRANAIISEVDLTICQ